MKIYLYKLKFIRNDNEIIEIKYFLIEEDIILNYFPLKGFN